MNGLLSEIESPKPRLTLRKPEKLRHKSIITPLFEKGESLFEYPLRLTWRILTEEELRESFRRETPPRFGKMQMLITVPKKKRKHAVDRVLMRRRIREAYRLNRLELADVINDRPDTGLLALVFIYMAPDNLPYQKVEKKMKVLLGKIKEKVSGASEDATVVTDPDSVSTD